VRPNRYSFFFFLLVVGRSRIVFDEGFRSSHVIVVEVRAHDCGNRFPTLGKASKRLQDLPRRRRRFRRIDDHDSVAAFHENAIRQRVPDGNVHVRGFGNAYHARGLEHSTVLQQIGMTPATASSSSFSVADVIDVGWWAFLPVFRSETVALLARSAVDPIAFGVVSFRPAYH